jgi:adenylate cyclase
VALRLAAAEQARRRVVAAFGRYLSPAVLDKVLAQGRLPTAERKTLSVLFSDIVAFSSYCDQVEPEQVHALLNEYLEEMVASVFAHEGTVDKFIGDGLLAFFGDPLEQPDHAQRAVKAGLDMLTRLQLLNERWRKQGRHTIQIRIGINTGPAVVGNVGATRRMEYTVLGDAVNRAQRLEAAARPGCLLIGEQTFELVSRVFPNATPVGEVPGKRSERFRAWELSGPAPGQGGKRVSA